MIHYVHQHPCLAYLYAYWLYTDYISYSGVKHSACSTEKYFIWDTASVLAGLNYTFIHWCMLCRSIDLGMDYCLIMKGSIRGKHMAITVECEGLAQKNNPHIHIKYQHSLFGDIYTLLLQLKSHHWEDVVVFSMRLNMYWNKGLPKKMSRRGKAHGLLPWNHLKG